MKKTNCTILLLLVIALLTSCDKEKTQQGLSNTQPTANTDSSQTSKKTFENEDSQKIDSLPYQIWEQYKPILEKEFGDKPTPDFGNGRIFVSQGMTTYQERAIHYIPLKNGSTKVFVFGANRHIVDDNDEGTYTIEEYNFDGKLHSTKLQKELQLFEISETLHATIQSDSLYIRDSRYDNQRIAIFFWDGEKFVRIPEIAKEVFKKEFPKIKEVYGNKLYSAYGSEGEECEGCGSGESVAIFPLKKGGYLATFTHDFNGPGCASEYHFWTKTYKDGKLSSIKNVLPLPKLEDLLKPNTAGKHKKDFTEFKKMFDKSPMDYISYEFQPPTSLTIRLHPWDCENAYNNMDKYMLDPYKNDQLPTYIWDGEKFTAPAKTAEAEYTGEGALPELVFDSLEFSEITYTKHPEVPSLIKNAKRIVLKGDRMTISDDKTETILKIDLSNSSEEANPDAYYWMYSTVENDALPATGFYILAEYEEACTARNLDPKKRPVSIVFADMGYLHTKGFNSWDGLKRKITKKYPSDEQYKEALNYINREEVPTPDSDEDKKSVHGDINQDGIEDVILYTDQEIDVALLDANDVITFEKNYKIKDENSSRNITEITINKKGVFVIKTEWTNERGANGNDNYTARYQNEDFYLIGYDSYYKPATNESYNLLTYKKIVTTGQDNDDKKTTTSVLKKIPLHRLSDIKLGEYQCDDYNGIE